MYIIKYSFVYEFNSQFVDDVLEIAGSHFTLHNLHHLATYRSDLCRLGICSLLDLVLTTLREADTEQSQQVAVGCLDIHVSFDHRLSTARNSQWVH